MNPLYPTPVDVEEYRGRAEFLLGCGQNRLYTFQDVRHLRMFLDRFFDVAPDEILVLVRMIEPYQVCYVDEDGCNRECVTFDPILFDEEIPHNRFADVPAAQRFIDRLRTLAYEMDAPSGDLDVIVLAEELTTDDWRAAVGGVLSPESVSC